jgi:hypothetical protein
MMYMTTAVICANMTPANDQHIAPDYEQLQRRWLYVDKAVFIYCGMNKLVFRIRMSLTVLLHMAMSRNMYMECSARACCIQTLAVWIHCEGKISDLTLELTQTLYGVRHCLQKVPSSAFEVLTACTSEISDSKLLMTRQRP